jgi:hypothetical protein
MVHDHRVFNLQELSLPIEPRQITRLSWRRILAVTHRLEIALGRRELFHLPKVHSRKFKKQIELSKFHDQIHEIPSSKFGAEVE